MPLDKSNSDIEFKKACHLVTKITTKNLSTMITDALWYTITSSKVSILNDLIISSSKILETAEGGELLWHVIDKGNIELATILVNSGANLHVRKPNSPQNLSFLHSLVQQHNSKAYYRLAQTMIDKGADFNARDSRGRSVLYHAIWYDSIDMVNYLVKRGALIDVDDEEQSNSVLVLALGKSNAKYLLNLMVYSIEDENVRHARSMFIAEFYIDNDVDLKFIEEIILKRGLPVDYVNPHGWTLLNRAVSWGRVDLIELLLNYGADVNKETNLKNYPLYLAVCLPETHITALLIERGANIHAINQDGDSALHRACESQSANNIQLLLYLGADINVKNNFGLTPFSLINCDYLTTAIFHVVRHLAFLFTKCQKMNNDDEDLIYQRSETERLYKVCLKELEKMKDTEICNEVSYFCILDKSSSELSALMKNKKFVDNFNDQLRRASDSFPLMYLKQMKSKLDIAMKMEKLSSITRNNVTEIFSKILPSLVIDKIARYLYFDEWNMLEQKYYLQLQEFV